MNIISYKNLSLDKISVVGKDVKYDNESFYIQTPIIESSEIKNFNGRNYIQLNFLISNAHDVFLKTLKKIDKKISYLLDSESFLLKDIHEKVSMKVNIPDTINVFYNKDKKCILPSEVYQKTKCICIIFLSNNEWSLYQYMRL